MEEVITVEQIAQRYSAMMDSVVLLENGKPEGMSAEDWSDVETRNKEHISLTLDKEFWTTEDMTRAEAVVVVVV